MAGKPQQELERTGHTVSPSEESSRGTRALTSLSSFHSAQDCSRGMTLLAFKMALPTSVNPIKTPHRCTPRPACLDNSSPRLPSQ